MRAAFMHDVGRIEVEDAPETKPDDDGALLRVEACGICGTDARTFFNGDPRAPAPWVLGHEPVGALEDVGPGATLPAGIEPRGDVSGARPSCPRSGRRLRPFGARSLL